MKRRFSRDHPAEGLWGAAGSHSLGNKPLLGGSWRETLKLGFNPDPNRTASIYKNHFLMMLFWS